MFEPTLITRFRESNTRLPEPVVFGSDYSIHPMPGQQGFDLFVAGYAEAAPTAKED